MSRQIKPLKLSDIEPKKRKPNYVLDDDEAEAWLDSLELSPDPESPIKQTEFTSEDGKPIKF